jgi:hypothetical protein
MRLLLLLLLRLRMLLLVLLFLVPCSTRGALVTTSVVVPIPRLSLQEFRSLNNNRNKNNNERPGATTTNPKKFAMREEGAAMMTTMTWPIVIENVLSVSECEALCQDIIMCPLLMRL